VVARFFVPNGLVSADNPAVIYRQFLQQRWIPRPAEATPKPHKNKYCLADSSPYLTLLHLLFVFSFVLSHFCLPPPRNLSKWSSLHHLSTPLTGTTLDSGSEKVFHPALRIYSHDSLTFSLVNGHVESHYSVKTGVWSKPEYITDPFLRLHGMAPALNYGQQAYEGMKAFRSPNNEITIFRPNRNAARLAHSASFVSIPPVPESVFQECVHAAVSLNAEFVPPHETGAAMYIRPLIFGSSAQLGLNPPEEYTFCVYVLPVGVYHGVHPVKALVLEDFDRAAPDGTGSAKVGGNYAPVLKWSDKARNEGYGITLHLDSKTRSEIDEFSTSGFIGVKKDGEDITLVVPDSKNVISSVTSDSVLDIAKSFGWKTERRSVSVIK
jgi:branched-chain amino acid aminotransferase